MPLWGVRVRQWAPCVFLRDNPLTKGRAVAVCAHRGSIDITQECVRCNFTGRAVRVRAEIKIGERAGNRCVLEDFVDDRAGRNPGRDEHGWNADAEPVEVERVWRASGAWL